MLLFLSLTLAHAPFCTTDEFHKIATVHLKAIGTLAMTATDHGLQSAPRRRWPFIALTSFERRANTVKDLSGALSVTLCPIVRAYDRRTWEKYVTVSDDARWYQESVAQQAARGLSDLDNRLPIIIIAANASAYATTTTGTEPSDDQQLTFDNGTANRIYNLDREKEGATAYISPVEDLYLPIWQVRS
jgi:hypothetical protein